MGMNFHKPSFKMADILVFFVILGASILLLKGAFFGKHDKVFVNADGVQYEFDLSKNGVFKVKGAIGITQFEIKDGKVRIIDSPCPNKTCIACGFSDIIVCLPNNVIIQRICDSENEGLDAVAQ